MGLFAHGTTFSIGAQVVGDITNITGPNRTRDAIETTDHDSGGDEEMVPGLRRGGTVSIEGNLASGVTGDAGQDALEDNADADGSAAIEEMILTLPDDAGATATTYTFDGFVIQSPSPTLPYDDKATYSAEIQVTGAITKAKATAA